MALVFHAAGLFMTLILQGLCGSQAPRAVADRHCDGEDKQQEACEQAEAQLFGLWSLALCISAAAMFGTWLFGDVCNMAALILGLMGAVFAVANWVPYALLSIHVSIMQQAKHEFVEYGDGSPRDGPSLDYTTAVLAIHNGAICTPQILSSGMTSFVFWVMNRFHLSADVSWAFLIIVPSLLLAAWDRDTVRVLGGRRRSTLGYDMP